MQMRFRSAIEPNDYAVAIQPVEVETGSKNLQQNEKEAKHVEGEVKQMKKTHGKQGRRSP